MLDLNRPLQTLRGKKVKLLAVVPELKFCIIGLIEGSDEVDTWTENGSFQADEIDRSTFNLCNPDEDAVDDDEDSRDEPEPEPWPEIGQYYTPEQH